MPLLKKLIFALPFIFFLSGFSLSLNSFLQDPNLTLSLNSDTFVQTIILTSLVILTGVFFTIFVTISANWTYILAAILIAALSTILLLPAPVSFIFLGAILIFFPLIAYLLMKKLTAYLTFQPSVLLSPAVKQLTIILIIIASLALYLSSDQIIQKQGFQLPDSLIDTTLQFIPKDQLALGNSENSLPALSADQIALLEKNPQALIQAGIDPKILASIKESQSQGQLSPESLLKPLIRTQMQNFITPYEKYVSLFLGIIFFFTLQTLSSLLSIFLSPLLSLIFYLLEKTGFTRYEIETREVKKLVV